VRTISSHLWIQGERNRFAWDTDAFSAIVRFGGWIFISTATTFLVGEGNRLLLGAFLDIKELAFYSLAASLNILPLQVTQQIGNKVLFPAFSELAREDVGRLRKSVWRARMVIFVPFAVAGLAFALFGRELIAILYDDRYKPAGWMLTILALGAFPQAAIISYGPILWAVGQLRTSTALLFIQLALQLACLSLGALLLGSKGLVIGLSLALWLLYPFHAFIFRRLAVWQPSVDIPYLILAFVLSLYVFLGSS
jgi:O-antigen/teichoic acid export membrane protein